MADESNDIKGVGRDMEAPVERGSDEPRQAPRKFIDFASMTWTDLKNIGIQVSKGHLCFYPEAFQELLSTKDRSIKNELTSLHIRIKDIFRYTNVRVRQGEKIIDPILMSIAKIAAKRHSGRNHNALWCYSHSEEDCDVVMFPQITLPISPPFRHPKSTYEVLLTGDVEGIAQVDADLQPATVTTSQIFFVIRAIDWNLHKPEVVGQALALMDLSKRDTVRFCVTDGHTWQFVIVTKDVEGEYTYYGSNIFRIKVDCTSVKDSEALNSLRKIVELAIQWLAPTKISSPQGLYHLYKYPNLNLPYSLAPCNHLA
ncbi:hypothetical protein BDR07DRAFT_1402234 [Suillus spraguei]|nr:hypothetical protein BDR07DRAFT_1402234 [Suillus spraguei]